jgi:hypothetical protein
MKKPIKSLGCYLAYGIGRRGRKRMVLIGGLILKMSVNLF